MGFALEHDRSGRLYRVVEVEEAPPPARRARRVLFTGSLESCEKALLEALEKKYGTGKINLPFPTLGGKQFWGDVFIHAGWRIQENAYTGHCRLLDPGDIRRAWGSYEACRVVFERHRIDEGIRPRSDRLVLLVHGMLRSRASFRKLARALEEAGYDVSGVSYPSTRRTLREHSRQLELVLERLEGTREVSFVTHSLGGLVVRDLLGRRGRWQQRIRVQRLVMLAPPSRGSPVAELLADWFPYQVVTGKVGQELAPEAVARIPPPSCPFAIIAGGTGTERGRNPLIPGDDDGVVAVEDTRLPGAVDFLLVDASHTFIMRHKEVILATLRFLRRGTLSDRGKP